MIDQPAQPPSLEAPAAAPPSRRPEIVPPDWAVRPSAELIARALNSVGIRSAPDGVRVQLRCRIDLQGVPQDCVVVSSTSSNPRYGEGALRVSRELRFHPQTVDGRPTGDGVVIIPLRLEFYTRGR